MTLTRRLIVCLDVQDGRVVKGTGFKSLRDVGDPVELARRYEAEGADEIAFLDISATYEARGHLLEVTRRTAEQLFIPLTIGGGMRTLADITAALRAGADKVSVNSAAVSRPEILTEGAALYGAQCIVASIDARREGDGWRVYTSGGRTRTDLDAVEWARECVARGAGEILLTSIDRDGARDGYDIALTRVVADAVQVPVIASGGAGRAEHLSTAVIEGGADAVLVAGILHDGVVTVKELKSTMRAAMIPVREVAA